jgi:hypothetical protein
MNKTALAVGVMFVGFSAVALAQPGQQPAGATSAQGRGQRPAPDPRSRGGGDCRE